MLELRANCECIFSLTTLQRTTCWLLSREQAANQSHALIWLSLGILSALTKRIEASKNEFATTLWATTFSSLNRRQLEEDHQEQGMLSLTLTLRLF